MSFFGSSGLRREHFPELRARFDALIRKADKDPKEYDSYFRKEIENISVQVLELPSDQALKKALEMIETSARFELMRKDIVRGLLDGTI